MQHKRIKNNATGIDTSKLAIDVGKLKTVSADLSKLSNVVNNDVVKKTAYDKLVAKVNNMMLVDLF